MRVGTISLALLAGATTLTLGAAQPNSHQSSATSAVALGHPLTLETGQDNGFLNCAAAVLSPDFRNDNTDGGFSKLSTKMDPNAIAFIVGHGDAGFICTGDGNNCGGAETGAATLLSTANEPEWRTFAQKIKSSQKGFKEVQLWGCYIGADKFGAALLHKLAKAVGCNVSAPTSLFWCGNGRVWIDPPSPQQMATPDQEPTIIPKPTIVISKVDVLRFKAAGKVVDVPADRVQMRSFRDLSMSAEVFHEEMLSVGPKAVNLIDFAHPFEPRGVPSAVGTARISLQIDAQSGTIEKNFLIYDDAVAQDIDNPEVFYWVDSRFGQRRRELEEVKLNRR